MKRARKRKVSGSSAGRKGSTPKSSASSRSRDAVMPNLAPPSTLRVQKLGVERDAKALGANTIVESEEKREPASDIDTGVVDGLKVLDPERPIREAAAERRSVGRLKSAFVARLSTTICVLFRLQECHRAIRHVCVNF